MIDLSLTGALADFYARAWFTPALAAYLRDNALDLEVVAAYAGTCAVLPVVDCGKGRFDFGRPDLDPLAFVIECQGEDGETEDVIAWPVTDPTNVMSMLARVGIVGISIAMDPFTYRMGRPLRMHRTPLNWLKAGCKGAAIGDKRIAARQFLDLPGQVAGQDQQHGRELLAIAESLIDRSRFVAARQLQDAA